MSSSQITKPKKTSKAIPVLVHCAHALHINGMCGLYKRNWKIVMDNLDSTNANPKYAGRLF